MAEKLHPHPGLILKCRLRQRGLPFFDLAMLIKFDEDILKEVIDLKTAMSLELCEKLSRYFGDRIDFWIKLQVNYELSIVAFETRYPSRHPETDDSPLPPLPTRFG